VAPVPPHAVIVIAASQAVRAVVLRAIVFMEVADDQICNTKTADCITPLVNRMVDIDTGLRVKGIVFLSRTAQRISSLGYRVRHIVDPDLFSSWV
jgi:hypothetical protein